MNSLSRHVTEANGLRLHPLLSRVSLLNYIMTKRDIISALLFLALYLVSAKTSRAETASDDPVGVWIKHVHQCLRRVFSIRADFVQEIRFKKEHPAAGVQSGVIEVRRGGLYRLTYNTPEKRLLVSDGRIIWSFDKPTKTVYTTATDNTILDEALGLLAGGDEAKSAFAVRYLGGAIRPDEGRSVLELVPIKKDSLISSIVVTLDGRCPCIQRLLVVDHAGSAIRITLGHIETNVGLGKQRFTFKPPKGTRVINP